MEINYQFLNDGYIPQIHGCWMESFKDYHVDMSYMTLDRMISRARMDRVDFGMSVGAFYKDKMVGFLLIGLDKVENELTAFDAGTGVIKEYRGNGIAGEMFDFAKAKLQFADVKHFILEVIQDNKPAIKAYEKAGFKIKRSFNCYNLDAGSFSSKLEGIDDISIRQITKSELGNYLDFVDWDVSWEYNFSAINRIQEDIIIDGAFVKNKCVGFIVFYPTLNWIFMLAVNKNYRRQKLGTLLITELLNKIKRDDLVVKFNNIIPDHEMNNLLVKLGFSVYIKQFEMDYLM